MPPAKGKKRKREEKKRSDGGWPQSTLMDRVIDTLNRRHPGFIFRLPTAEENPGTWITDELCLFIEFFKDGPLLPLPNFLIRFCRQFKLVPAMLMPNTLIILRGLYSFYGTWQVPWNKESILSLITFTLKEPGSFYAQPKRASEFKMVGIPSSRHGWKEKYAFVRSEAKWPICTIPLIPEPEAYKGWGITKRLSDMLETHGSQPFRVNIETLEILPAEEGDAGKKKGSTAKKSGPGKKVAALKRANVEPDSESEASSGDSEDDDESSIKWSEETTTPKLEKKVDAKPKKGSGIVIREPSSVPTALILEESTNLKGKEKVVEPEPSASTDLDRAIGGPAEETEPFIPEPTKATTAEPIEVDTAKPAETHTAESHEEEAAAEEEWEWHYDKDIGEFTLKKNNKYRFIPEMNSSGVPLMLPPFLKHPEDDQLLNMMSDYDIGALQTHLCLSNMILGCCLTDRAMAAAHEITDYKAELANSQEMLKLQRILTQRYRNESEILGSTVQSQDIEHKEVVATLKAKEATLAEELLRKKAEVERLQQLNRASEETLQAERKAAAIDKEAMQAKVVKLEEALAQADKSQRTSTTNIQEIIEEYKDTDEHQLELKDVGSYGFNLLKRVLIQEKKLSTAELNVYDYDNCVLEDADGNIPP